MKDVTKTSGADGKRSQIEHIFIRGSHISFIVFPSMLKKAPMFRRVRAWRKHRGHPQKDAARGQAAAIIRKALARQTQLSTGGFPALPPLR